MTAALVFVIIGIVALLLVMGLLRATRFKGGNLDELAAQLRPIDIHAFQNLIDEREEQFLRESLPWSEFRSIHGQRMLAAAEYVWGAARNAGILIQLAEAAIADSDPDVVSAAKNLLENATGVRLYAVQEIPRLYISILIPSLNHAPTSLAERYDTMTRQGVLLNCLRPPAHVASVTN